MPWTGSPGLARPGPSDVVMPVLIDGDNLLHVARGVLENAERANRARLCRLLARWDAEGRYGVTIFFDGVRPASAGDGPLASGRLSVRYSDARTADDLIVEAIESSSSPRRLLVVSSDRQVRAAARRRRARSLDSDTFITQVLKALARAHRPRESEPRQKFDGLAPGEAEQWLEELGVEPEEEDDRDEFGLL